MTEKFTDCKGGKKKKEKDKLSYKHKLFINNLIDNKFNQTKAYQATYPDTEYYSARVSASQLLTNPNILSALEERLKETGLDYRNRDSKLKRLTEAQKPYITKQGIELYPDNNVQLNALITAYKLTGELGKEDKGSNTYIDNRSISTADSETLLRIIKEVKELNAQAEIDQEAMRDWKPA